MSRYNHPHTLKTRDYIYRILICILSVTILALGFPTSPHVGRDYKLGEPWNDRPLIATDSFRVWKTEEMIAKERDSILQFYEPYFRMKTPSEEEQTKLICSLYQKKGMAPSLFHLRPLIHSLNKVYHEGIMNQDEHEQLVKEKVVNVRFFEDNQSRITRLASVHTPKEAYKHIMEEMDSLYPKNSDFHRIDLAEAIHSNLTFDESKSAQQKQDVIDLLIPYIGQIKVGEKIVDRGQIVDEYTYCVLQSMEKYENERGKNFAESASLWVGRILFFFLLTLVLVAYFQNFRSDYLDSLQTILFIVTLFLCFPLLTFLLIQHQFLNVLLIPYCILPIFVRIFLDSRTAFVTHIITLFICALALSKPFEFLTIQLIGGMVSIYSLRQLTQRSDLFSAIVLVILSTIFVHFCLDLSDGLFFDGKKWEYWDYLYLFLAGVLTTISYLLLITIEHLFGFTSNVTLVELSNINNPILRRLSEEAPGTFQHSMQVANLSAEVANHIGARSQLVRTAALYHDIGKLENPVFFTENQTGQNPHNALSYEQSAQMIIKHVHDGLKLGEKYKLPKVITDFIVSHHGRGMTKFFYISYKNQFPDKEIDEQVFTYPGPNPQTKEQAILMMSDAIEAASRSLPEYTEESVNTLVDKIIDEQTASGYFNQCPITFLDIQVAKDVFKTKLKTIYHTRISYPELKK